MKFLSSLEQGIFLRRYKRFFADIKWQGQTITAHVPNTGSMKSCLHEGSPCLFHVNDDPKRKLKYTLEMLQSPTGTWIGVNTQTPNKLVHEALLKKLLPHWAKLTAIQPEVKINEQTRIDFCCLADEKKHYIEVKNVTYAEGDVALFPDSVTERGLKHLLELQELIRSGASAEVVFTVQRNDVQKFSAAAKVDSQYAQELRRAFAAGVMITPLIVDLTKTEAILTEKKLPIEWT